MSMEKLIFLAFLGLAAPAVVSPVWADDTLFADMGGLSGIDKVVDASVDAYLVDPRIAAIFSETNIARLRAEFKVQICQVAGGPCLFVGFVLVVVFLCLL